MGKHGEFHPKYHDKFPEKKKVRNLSQHLPKKQGFVNHHWSYRPENWDSVIILSARDHKSVHKHMVYIQSEMCYKSKITGILMDTREKHLEHAQLAKALSHQITGKLPSLKYAIL